MPSEAVENYLKAVHTLCMESPAGEAAMSKIAAVVGVTTGTATTMIKRLAAGKFVRYERFGGVTLTPRGQTIALDILRRHRLIETFLVQALKLDWSVVHAEAERLEHAVSPRVLDALDAMLGHPRLDPHGDPIPQPGDKREARRGRPLDECSAGQRLTIARITDEDERFLNFIAQCGLRPGSGATVVALDAQAQSVTVQASGHAPVTLALAAARKVWAESA